MTIFRPAGVVLSTSLMVFCVYKLSSYTWFIIGTLWSPDQFEYSIITTAFLTLCGIVIAMLSIPIICLWFGTLIIFLGPSGEQKGGSFAP